MGLTTEDIRSWIVRANEQIQQNKEYLTELDQAIGDGDHGINMARGFQEAAAKTGAGDYASVADLVKDWGMTLLSKVGGASGPLYGTAFMKFSAAVKGKEEIDYETFREAVEEGLNGLILRGKAQEGDKTMIDVWAPLVTFLKENDQLTSSALDSVVKEAMENTKEMKANKGRAAYLGDRSIGHLDPGSVSSYYLFSSLADLLEEKGMTL